MAPPPPPPDPPRPPPSEVSASSAWGGPRRPRRGAFYVPGGSIRYYETGNRIEYVCGNPLHGKCVLTRQVNEGARPAQGRPNGLGVAWLALGPHCSKHQHHPKAKDPMGWPTRSQRQAGRDYLKGLDSDLPEAAALLRAERPKRSGEESEPEDEP
eukprot:3574524-Pyramimonas_sp.AAC.1